MTRTLVAGLASRDEFDIRHVNTQVSRTLSEKGGHHQVRKAARSSLQTVEILLEMFRFNPDLVYLPLTNSPSFMGFLRDGIFIGLACLFRKKIAVRLHGGYYFYAHTTGIKRHLVRILLNQVSLAMVQGARLTGVFEGLIAPQRIATVPNGLDGKPFSEARARLKDAQQGSRKKVLFVGLMCREKGFHDVLAAIPMVPNGHFVFMGEWSSENDRKKVTEWIERRGLGDRVTFAGVVSGVPKYDIFLSADVFVFPTFFVYEGHAVSSVEALAAGLPIVCTDHGALNESVRDGWNGYFVKRLDPEDIAARLNLLLSDDRLLKEMSKRSRALFEQKLTLDRFMDLWTSAIRTCLSAPSSVQMEVQ
jgi:glycosyltransferase involved in cell wall biosynthesis